MTWSAWRILRFRYAVPSYHFVKHKNASPVKLPKMHIRCSCTHSHITIPVRAKPHNKSEPISWWWVDMKLSIIFTLYCYIKVVKCIQPSWIDFLGEYPANLRIKFWDQNRSDDPFINYYTKIDQGFHPWTEFALHNAWNSFWTNTTMLCYCLYGIE